MENAYSHCSDDIVIFRRLICGHVTVNFFLLSEKFEVQHVLSIIKGDHPEVYIFLLVQMHDKITT